MKEVPPTGSIEDLMENGDIVDVPQIPQDFTNDIGALFDVMKKADPSTATYLGKLHEFDLIYDGITLDVGHTEMHEEAIKKLRSYFLEEYFTDNSFPEGDTWNARLRQNGRIIRMWILSLEVFYSPNHFENSPDVVFSHLKEIAEKLGRYREDQLKRDSASDRIWSD